MNLANTVEISACLDVAKKHLTNAICAIRAFRTEVPMQQLTCQKRPAPNSQMEHQLRYHSTKKVKLGRSGSLTKPSEAQSIEARESLKDVDIRVCTVCMNEDDATVTPDVDWRQCSYCNLWLHVVCAHVTSNHFVCNTCLQ